jgi:hypothetical protein
MLLEIAYNATCVLGIAEHTFFEANFIFHLMSHLRFTMQP